MDNGKINIKPVIGIILLTVLMVSCILQALDNDIDDSDMTGTLKGKISIGPLCPVESDPPLPECLPTEETYKTWAIAVWSQNHNIKFKDIKPNLDGTYTIELPANDYTIDFEKKQNFAVGGSNLPVQVTIEPNVVLEIDIDIDTGIR